MRNEDIWKRNVREIPHDYRHKTDTLFLDEGCDKKSGLQVPSDLDDTYEWLACMGLSFHEVGDHGTNLPVDGKRNH